MTAIPPVALTRACPAPSGAPHVLLPTALRVAVGSTLRATFRAGLCVGLAVAVLAACGSPDDAASGSSPSVRSQEGPTSDDATQPPTEQHAESGAAVGTAQEPTRQPRRIEVTVAGDEVTPTPGQVDLAVGDTLTLVVTSDRDSELHAHGFDVEVPAPAGTPTEVQLTGTETGVYEVELHDPDLLLMQVAVR